jgi:hypothetical protein
MEAVTEKDIYDLTKKIAYEWSRSIILQKKLETLRKEDDDYDLNCDILMDKILEHNRNAIESEEIFDSLLFEYPDVVERFFKKIDTLFKNKKDEIIYPLEN